MKRNRALLALLPVAIAASVLTSCSASGASSAIDGVDCAPEGDISKSLEITGDFGASDLQLKTKTPIDATALQVSKPIAGDGDRLKENDSITARLTVFNGTSGESAQSAESSFVLNKDQMVPWALQVLACATVGDRVAAVAPVTELFGEDPASLAGSGLEDADTVVMVFDVSASGAAAKEPGTLEPGDLLKKAEGEAQKLPKDLPTVVLADDGSPTITMPEGVAAPDKLTVETMIKGDGETVQEGDRVYVHYRGVIWRTGEEFDSSWSRGAPIDFLTTQVIGGFSKALVGQTVGSQVMSIVPAEDGGYGAATLQQQGHEPDDVMVFVLDILGTVHAG